MGFASGSISFRRYGISGRLAKNLTEKRLERLQENAFGSSREASSDGTEIGWVAPTHLFDTILTEEKISIGPYLHLWLRLDRTKPPSAVVKSYRQMEEAAALEASGRDTLTREERRLAREAAESKADKEARSGAFRRITVHPILIDLERQMAYFASLGETVHEKLAVLFSDTFDASLVPLNAAATAGGMAEKNGRLRQFEDALPTHFAKPPTEGEGEFDNGERGFLGREFLTWLWYHTETQEGVVPLKTDSLHALPDDVTIYIDKSMQLECDFKITGRDVVYSDGPGRSPEALAAVQIGKQPTKMGFILVADGYDYSFSLDAKALAVRGLKLPLIDADSDEELFDERCKHVVRLGAILDGMYGSFVAERFSSGWDGRVREIRNWATGKNGDAQPLRLAT